jgi:alkyl hydroperoxide reductase subunit AhpC
MFERRFRLPVVAAFPARRACAALLFGLLCIQPSAHAVDANQPAPPFEAPAMVGALPIRLASHIGQVVLVDFWASWCGTCRHALPQLDRLRAEFASRGFEVIGVNVDENSQDGLNLLKGVAISYPLIRDPRGTIAQSYDVRAMPSSYLIDRRGVVRNVYRGYNNDELKSLQQAVARLVEEK